MTRLPLRRAAFVLTCLLGLLCIGAVYVTLDGVTDQLIEQDRRSIADRRDLRAKIAQHETVNDALAEQVKALGGHPVADPDPASPTTYIPVPGEPGDDGEDGRNARPATVGELAAAVAAYCTRNRCTGKDSTVSGPKGDDGKDGADGKDSTVPGPAGRGIASISCAESNDWIVTYTDGATQTVSGPCRVVAAPTPDPVPGS